MRRDGILEGPKKSSMELNVEAGLCGVNEFVVVDGLGAMEISLFFLHLTTPFVQWPIRTVECTKAKFLNQLGL